MPTHPVTLLPRAPSLTQVSALKTILGLSLSSLRGTPSLEDLMMGADGDGTLQQGGRGSGGGGGSRGAEPSEAELADALEECRAAVEKIVIPKQQAVELLPRPPAVIARQVALAQSYRLITEQVGASSASARLRILPEYDVAAPSGAPAQTVA